MRGAAFLMVLVLTGCGSSAAEHAQQSSTGCGDAGYVPRDLDAAAKDVTVGDAAAATGDAAPDPAHWSCNTDDDCAVFPSYPYCDGHSCSAAETVTFCTAGGLNRQEGYGVKHTYVASNGTFSDNCDENGNLLDYKCVAETKCGPGPNPACNNLDTGEVASTTVDCAGTCMNGRCDSRCPQQGDHLTFLETQPDGSAVIHNDTDGRAYSCTLQTDSPADSFDCKTVGAGQTGIVLSLGLSGRQCPGADFGGIGVALPGVPTSNGGENCDYKCGIDPTPVCSP